MQLSRTLRILLVGSGGREHALAWRCAREGHEVIAAPGSDGIRSVARCHDVPLHDHDGLTQLAAREGVDLVVVGPEQPLVEGLADRLRAAGLAVFGPSAAAAELEGSKVAAKAFMTRHGIPTAAYRAVASLEEGLTVLRQFEQPPVIKASGLAAGKGVVVSEDFAQAEAALRQCLDEHRFGAAGATVVLEERLLGEEVSFFVISDGEHAVTFDAAQDHKRLRDGDLGPNTGGMGAYAPAPVFTELVRARTMEAIVEPTLAGLRSEGHPFCGVLFVGLMIDDKQRPSVIEYNVRFGDPEAQALLFGLETPLVPHLMGAAAGRLEATTLPGLPSAVVVLAAEGYPESTVRGVPVRGIERAAEVPDSYVFHAGTRRSGDDWLTNGGRVLAVTAKADALETAIARAYESLDHITLAGGQMRRDVGARALSHLGLSSPAAQTPTTRSKT